MNTKQLSEFLGKNKSNIIRHAVRCGMFFNPGVEKIYNKKEVLIIAQSFYTKLPKSIQLSIDNLDVETVANATVETVANATVEIDSKSKKYNLWREVINEIEDLNSRVKSLEKFSENTKLAISYDSYYLEEI